MTLALDPFELAARSFEAPPEPPEPATWARTKLGAFLWSKQRDITHSVKHHRRTAVRSGHGVGKSWTAAMVAAWWIDTHPAGEAIVVSTAPTHKQVHAVLWAEIAKAHKKGRLAGKILQTDEWKIGDTLVAMGRKPADHDEHGFQGIHRRYVLVILDEACGVPAALWTGAEAITTNADCRILAIGNPDDPATEFGRVCKPGSGWNVIGVSTLDSPNFTDEPVPEFLKPLLPSPEWVDDARRSWGEASPRFASKVLGEFPDVGEDTLIPPSWITAAQQRDLEPSLDHRVGADIARFGSDESIAMHARGPVVRLMGAWSKQATTETTGAITAAARQALDPLVPFTIRVDGVGVGGGVVDQLAELDWPVIDMQAGSQAMDPAKFLNARAEWYWGLRLLFQDGAIDIDPDDDELAAQLGSIKYKFTSRGQIQIESKADMKKRGMPSPDRADALMLTMAFVPEVTDDVLDEEDIDPGYSRDSITPYQVD